MRDRELRREPHGAAAGRDSKAGGVLAGDQGEPESGDVGWRGCVASWYCGNPGERRAWEGRRLGSGAEGWWPL